MTTEPMRGRGLTRPSSVKRSIALRAVLNDTPDIAAISFIVGNTSPARYAPERIACLSPSASWSSTSVRLSRLMTKNVFSDGMSMATATPQGLEPSFNVTTLFDTTRLPQTQCILQMARTDDDRRLNRNPLVDKSGIGERARKF